MSLSNNNLTGLTPTEIGCLTILGEFNVVVTNRVLRCSAPHVFHLGRRDRPFEWKCQISLDEPPFPPFGLVGEFIGGRNDGPLGGIISLINQGKLDAMLQSVGAMP